MAPVLLKVSIVGMMISFLLNNLAQSPLNPHFYKNIAPGLDFRRFVAIISAHPTRVLIRGLTVALPVRGLLDGGA